MEIIVGCLEGSVMKMDMDGLVKIHRNMSRLQYTLNWVENLGFGRHVVLGVSLCVLSPFKLRIFMEYDPSYPWINMVFMLVAKAQCLE